MQPVVSDCTENAQWIQSRESTSNEQKNTQYERRSSDPAKTVPTEPPVTKTQYDRPEPPEQAKTSVDDFDIATNNDTASNLEVVTPIEPDDQRGKRKK